MSLASRGAPEAQMRGIELHLEAIDVSSHSGDHGAGQRQPAPLWTTVPESGWLHRYEFSLVDAAGDPVPRGVLHHLQVMAPKHRELFSPLMLHLAGAGEETSTVSLPKNVGYPLVQGDSLLVTAMLHNPGGESLEGVEVRVTLYYSPEGNWRAPLDVVPFFTHVTPPTRLASYDLPPGRSETSLEVEPVVTGRILGIGGHLHRYGVSLRLEDVELEQVLWEGKARLASDGTVIDVDRDQFVWSNGLEVVVGRTYRVVAVYDNPTGETILDGEMGTVGGVILPDGAWPEVDQSNPDYLWYLNPRYSRGRC